MSRGDYVKVECPKCNHGVVMEYDLKTHTMTRSECDLCDGLGTTYLYLRDAYIEEVKNNFTKKGCSNGR